MSMARSSLMVYHAVSAFSSLQLQRNREQRGAAVSYYYDQSETEIAGSLLEDDDRVTTIDADVSHILTALFLLSYIDVS